MAYVRIESGKSPDEFYNVSLGFWLPPASPYGNFQLKFMSIVERLDEANRRIEESFRFWEHINCEHNRGLPTAVFSRHIFANEQAIYMMRRAADELVSLIWLLSEYEQTGKYPDAIKVDSLARVLKEMGNTGAMALYEPHKKVIKTLNDISNAFKHSFINSDISLVGSQEPRVHALGLASNRLSAGANFHEVSLAELVREYSSFYQTSVQWLYAYSGRNRAG